MKNAGAEAIAINGERIVSTSAISCDGNVIVVNGKKIIVKENKIYAGGLVGYKYVDELAEGHLGTVAQRGLVEIVEDIVYQHRSRDVGERELQRGVARGLRVGERLYLLLMVTNCRRRRSIALAMTEPTRS